VRKVERFLLIGLIVVALGVLVAGFNTPIFAHDPGGEVGEGMHQACENSDYEAMDEWHAEYHCVEDSMNEGMAGSGMMGMMGGMH
jgi:hypothetical protein